MTDQPLAEMDLATLVDEWLDWAAVAEHLGVTVSRVRTMIQQQPDDCGLLFTSE